MSHMCKMYSILIFGAIISLFVCTETVVELPVFGITSPYGENNFTVDEGNLVLKLEISGIKEEYDAGLCEGSCTIDPTLNVSTSTCKTEKRGSLSYLNVEFKKITVKVTHSGEWNCSFVLPHKFNESFTLPLDHNQKMFVTVKGKIIKEEKDEKNDQWIMIFIIVGACVLVIIIGQAICIMYFKAKARRAEIAKNLTPNKTSDDLNVSDSARYVNKDTGNSDATRESGIYEALDHVPIPPSIETLPGAGKQRKMLRSESQKNLGPIPVAAQTSTTPRRQPQTTQDPNENNAVEWTSILERNKNRPPLPLPTEEVYEVMTPEASPIPTKAFSRFNQNKILEKSPLLTDSKKKKFGQSIPMESLQNQRTPYSPPVVRKPPIEPPQLSVPSPGSSRGAIPPTGFSIPRPSGRPVGQGQMPGPGRPPPGAMAVMGGMPILPSMIANAILKPVTPRAPAKQPSGVRPEPSVSRMTPESSVSRMTPPSSFSRMTPAHPSVNHAPVLPFKPKPPLPLPAQRVLDPDEPSQEPGRYYGSSDEEFDNYDILPEYRIYGNAPPKKFN